MNYSPYRYEEFGEIKRRTTWLAVVIVLIFGILLIRAWQVQVYRGADYRSMAENNRVRLVQIPPARGFLYDRTGQLLVNNAPSFNLYLDLEDIPDLEAVLKRISGLIRNSEPDMLQTIRRGRSAFPLRSLKISRDLTLQEVARIEGHRLDLPGVRIEAEAKRHYLHGELAAHLIGHVGEVTERQLNQGIYSPDMTGTVVGQYGVEKTYDAWLRGQSGQKRIEVDAQGHPHRAIGIREPVRGNDLTLTIDLRLQRKAEQALSGQSGTIIAMDPWTGEILALVSRPAFDPNLLSGLLTPADWQELLDDPRHVLNNRAIQGLYPPGSIFKLVVAATVLERGEPEPQSTVQCEGGLQLGDRFFRDWKKGGHGTMDLHQALVESCDVFFYQAGSQLGVDTIAEYARSLGLGQKTGIPLASEKTGLVPSTDWKKKVKGERWYAGETFAVAIGQGYLTVTPIQMAVMTSALATRGYQYQPKIIRDDSPPILNDQIPFSPATFRALHRSLRSAVTEDRGTARAARSEQIEIAGKTGTAQVVGYESQAELPKSLEDHAWFVAMAPLEDPEIVVVVLIENGGSGGTVAAPVAREIIEEFFQNERSAHYRPL